MASHTNSTTWSSPAAQTSARFTRLQNTAQHLDLARSPFFPKTAAEYARYQAEYTGDVAERERRKLKNRIEEMEVRKRIERQAREDREEIERILRGSESEGGDVVPGIEGLQIVESHGGTARLCGDEREQPYEVQLAEARAGKARVEDAEVNVDVTGVTQPENDAAEDSSSEQIDSLATENASKEGSGYGKTKRKNHRGTKKNKDSMGKNKGEDVKPTVETPKPVESKEIITPRTPTTKPATESKAGAKAAASLLSHMAKDPSVKASKGGTPNESTSDLWRLFKASPIYNPAGGGAGLNAMFASLQRPSLTSVLGAATGVWAGDEHLKPEGRRDPATNNHRAAWPEMSESKAEGQYRKEAGKDRRLPIPRGDMMTKEAIVRAAGGQEKVDKMCQEEIDDVCREQAKKTGDQIPWMDRQPLRFDGIDSLESVDKQLREENERLRKGEPVCGPQPNLGAYDGGHGTYASHAAQGVQGEQWQRQRRGTNIRLRGGYNYPVTPRGRTGPPLPVSPPVQQKPINPKAMSYGADGPGDGMTRPPGGWVFDEEYLKQKGDWEDLLDNIFFVI